MSDFKAFAMLGDEYSNLTPLPKQDAVSVFDLKNAKLAFQYIQSLNYVICLKAESNTFALVRNVAEANEFYKK